MINENFLLEIKTFTLLDWTNCCFNVTTTVIHFLLAVLGSHRYYSATILQMSGVRDDRLAIWLAGLATLTNFLFTLLGVWLVERVGRRKLTLGSIIGKSLKMSTSVSDVYRSLVIFHVKCIIFFSTGTCLSLSLLAIGFLMSAEHSPPVTFHPLDPSMANSTCSKYQWVHTSTAAGKLAPVLWNNDPLSSSFIHISWCYDPNKTCQNAQDLKLMCLSTGITPTAKYHPKVMKKKTALHCLNIE